MAHLTTELRQQLLVRVLECTSGGPLSALVKEIAATYAATPTDRHDNDLSLATLHHVIVEHRRSFGLTLIERLQGARLEADGEKLYVTDAAGEKWRVQDAYVLDGRVRLLPLGDRRANTRIFRRKDRTRREVALTRESPRGTSLAVLCMQLHEAGAPVHPPLTSERPTPAPNAARLVSRRPQRSDR